MFGQIALINLSPLLSRDYSVLFRLCDVKDQFFLLQIHHELGALGHFTAYNRTPDSCFQYRV